MDMHGQPLFLSHVTLAAGFPRVASGLGLALGHPNSCTVSAPPGTPLPHVPTRRSGVCCQDGESARVVPAEAHGEEREVAAVGLIPARSSPRRGQHKPNLVADGGEIRHQHKSGFSTSLLASPPVLSQAAAADYGLEAQLSQVTPGPLPSAPLSMLVSPD